MYKCKICNKIYSNKIDYCECGSSDFEIIAQRKPAARPVENPEESRKRLISWIIFGVFVFAAILIWFI